jgi:hypothetical protein
MLAISSVRARIGGESIVADQGAPSLAWPPGSASKARRRHDFPIVLVEVFPEVDDASLHVGKRATNQTLTGFCLDQNGAASFHPWRHPPFLTNPSDTSRTEILLDNSASLQELTTLPYMPGRLVESKRGQLFARSGQ